MADSQNTLENLFTPDTRSFKTIELVNQGLSYDAVAKEMKYKGKGSVSSIVSKLRTKHKLRNASNPPPQPPASSTTTKVVSEVEEPLIPSYGIPPRPSGNVVQVEGFAPGKTVNLTPPNITLIQWFMSTKGYTGDLSDFINDAVEDFFRARNLVVKVVEENIVR